MIVRIMFEGQFEIKGATLDELNDVDNQIVDAIAANDEDKFRTLMARLHQVVIAKGRRVPAEDIVESDIILPPSDATMDEVQDMFSGDGIIPG
ncbi:MAG: hypothetical protein U0531_03055 [Dehalococcoidia bacterium]